MYQQSDLTALYPAINTDDLEEVLVSLHLIDPTPLRASGELRTSMERRGQLQPVILNAAGGAGYRVVDGRRRIAAARELEWKDIRAYIIDVDSIAEAAMAVTVNAVRSDNPVSDVAAIHAMAGAGYTEREIAQATGLKLALVRKRLKLSRLPESLYAGVLENRIAIGVAQRIAAQAASVQERLAEVYARTGRVTGDDVRAASRVGMDTSNASLADLFDPPVPPRADASHRIRAELVAVLASYRTDIDEATWRQIASDAWNDVTRGAA